MLLNHLAKIISIEKLVSKRGQIVETIKEFELLLSRYVSESNLVLSIPWASFSINCYSIFVVDFGPARTTAIYLPHIKVLMAKHSTKGRWLEIIKWVGVVGLGFSFSISSNSK